MNVFHCSPEKNQTFVIVFASYVTEGTFWSKTFWSKSFQEKFISSLSENFAAGFVRAVLEVSGSQLELRKMCEEKVSGKCSFFHIFPTLAKVSHEVLLHVRSIHPHDLFDYIFLKIFRYKNKRSRILTKRIVAPLTKITIPFFRGNFYSKNLKQVQKTNFFWPWGRKVFIGVNISALYVLRRKIWRIFFKLRFLYKKRKV